MGKITINEIHKSLFDYVQAVSDDKLETRNKTIVGAINELFSNNNNDTELNNLANEISNGKQLIANAIGEPLTAEDSFNEMSDDINSLSSTFKTNMMNNGITVESGDKFKQLIDKIATMVEEGVGKGIQMTSGEINSLSNNTYTTFDGLYSGYVYGSGWNRCNYIELSLNFTPTIILVQSTITTSGSSSFTIYSTTTYDNFSKNGIVSKAEFTCSATANNDGSLLHFSPKIENGKYILPVRAHNTNYPIGTIQCTWLAIGVGEEDTTLRDSLASVLEDEGVDVTEEDDMVSLITKTDEEFNKKNSFIGNPNNKEELYKIFNFAGCDVNETDNLDKFVDILKDRLYHPIDVKQVECGGGFIYVLKNDGTVWSCGANKAGQLGTGIVENYVPYFEQITDPAGTGVKQIACGRDFAYILKNDGSLYSIGNNDSGQLGLGNTTTHNSFSKVTTNINNDVDFVSCGNRHTMIIKKDGSLWACGENGNSQLGLNSTTDQKTFVQVTTNINNDVAYVSCGANHTMIIKKDSTLWACGEGGNGQLGISGSTADQKTFFRVATNVKQVSCGGYISGTTLYGNTLIIKNDGTVWGTGYNTNGQLGLGATTNYQGFTKSNSMGTDNALIKSCGRHSLLVKNDGTLWACGYNNKIQTGINTSATLSEFMSVSNTYSDIHSIISISGSSYNVFFSAVVRADGTLWCVGDNTKGQLGFGNTTEYYQFHRQKGFR